MFGRSIFFFFVIVDTMLDFAADFFVMQLVKFGETASILSYVITFYNS